MSLSLRKCFRNLCVLLIVSISFPFSNANAQIDYSEDFAACFAAPCEGWSWDSPSGLITPISTSGYSPCEVGNASATSNLNGAVSLATFMSTDSLGVSSGEPVMLSFDHKVLNNITGTAAADNSVTYRVEWSNVATGGTWNQVDQFNNVSGTTCETREVSPFIVPLGEKIYVRINLQRSTGNVWVVLDNINLFQPPPAVPGNTDCACNNDSSLNMDDGTFSSYLTIVYPGTDSMPSGLDYTLLTSTGLNNTAGGSADGLSFVHCVGGGCPTGITKGHYYLEVQVQNGGAFTTSVDGPDMDMLADMNLDLSSMCAISYPALPTVPFAAMNCLDLGINTFTWDVDAVVNRVNSPNGIVYPDGITQTGPREITIDDDLYFEADNQPDGLDFYFINTDAGTGCTVSSFINTEIFNAVSAGLIDVTLDCRRFRQNDSIFLTVMLDSTNSGGGEFLVNGNIIPEGKFGVSQDACVEVTYQVTDECGVQHMDTKNLLLTYAPKASFDFRNNVGDPVSPQCSSTDVNVELVRNSSATIFEWILASDDPAYTPTISGSTLTLPSPEISEAVSYEICLAESGSMPPMCAGLMADVCIDTLCKTFVVYRDKSDCGANALFTSTCEIYQPSLCETSPMEGLEIGCSFFSFETPAIITTDITLETPVAECTIDSISGSYDMKLFGISSDDVGGGKKIKSFDGISVICSVLNFKVLGWRPLGKIYSLLGCDKTIAQFIFGAISALAGGDGGGGLVMADTDGNGTLDYLINESIGTFPVSGDFTIPNNLDGPGHLSVRIVSGWVNSANTMCGDFGVEGVNVLDLLPIGAIPIVGPIIEDVLAFAGCNVNIAVSSETTKKVLIGNNEIPTFQNCNADGYTFAQTLECDLPVNWSIPIAYDACSGEEVIYRGITGMVDVSNLPGTPPMPVVEDQAGIYQTAGPAIGSVLTPGIYTITYLAVSCNGLPELCTFTATVTSGNPILEAPNDLVISTDLDLCETEVNGLAPYQGIGCASIINYSYTSPVTNTVVETTSTVQGEHNIPDGQIFELGITEIVYTMEVDINGDGDYDDINETQLDTFTITIVDEQRPAAICIEVDIQLDNTGSATVFARERTNEIYIDGGSTDNCGIDSILISKDNITFTDSLLFDCAEKGNNVINMKVVDVNGNVSFCKSVVNVIDYFEGFGLDLDLPEICFEPFQDSIDFSPYLTVARPTGDNISHQNVGTLGPEIYGVFGISSFLPDTGSSNDPGTITTDGLYRLGTGTGWITISYILAIDEQVNQLNDTTDLTGCFRMVHDVFRVEQLDPVWDGGFICCDQSPVFLGAAFWDGTGAPPLPAGLISLTDIRGSYPGDVQGDWTGDGVSFVDPDGTNFSGDEYFQFDPSGFDQSVTLTYTIGDEPCIFDYSQEILVTCQDLQIALSDTTVCPASIIPERVVITNLDDDDLVVTTTGLAAAGGVDLMDEPIVDGRVVIPGFSTVAVRNNTYTIGVSVYQTSDFGCADFFSYTITVRDTLPPFFQNCPKEPIIVEALPDLCGNFVNFEDPWADDNCFSLYTDIQQVDTTNLVSGDMFPVGTTILAYTATDTVGNQSYCEVKIVVNDFEQDPIITCPDNVIAVNDLGKCSAIIPDLPPAQVDDNCPNSTVTYEVTDENGKVLYCGFEDASGNDFPVGTTTVEYTVKDQSLLLITEIVQDGVTTGIEVTNFGPSAMDITCAQVAVFDAAGMQVDSFLIPTSNNKSTELVQVDFPPLPTIWDPTMPNNLSVGEAWTYTFSNNVPAGDEAHYEFSLLDRILDEVTVNDQVDGLVFLRETVCDHDAQSDFIAATPCDPGSFGVINPGLPVMTDNGLQSSIQAFDANVDTCSFNVVVSDIEAPVCIMHDSVQINANLAAPIDLGVMTCGTSIINIPGGGIVNDVNIYNLNITSTNAADLTVYLNSPQGTRILLFEGLCGGTSDVDVNLDATDNLLISPNITTAPCGPLGQGGIYSPQESFKAFFGEQSAGDWELEMFTSNGTTAQIVDWDLEILREELYAQGDTILENDPTLCSAEFTWTHPVFRDNCCDGDMTVEYAFSNTVTGVSSIEGGSIQSIDGSINIDGTEITRTFDVGLTVITYTLIDQYGNQSQCGFDVLVEDTEEPTFLIGCQDWVVQLDGGECYGALPRVPPTDDNCAVDSISFCDENGVLVDVSLLPIGVNNITMKSVDIYGNVATCEFVVDILEHVPASNGLTCNQNLNLSLGIDCMAEITADMILEGNDYGCYEDYIILVEDKFGILHANQFDITDVGQTFKVSVMGPAGVGNTCWGYITIEEKLVPQFECPRDTVLYCNIDPLAVDDFGDLLTGELNLLSCEINVEVTYQDHLENYGACAAPRAKLVRRWRVDDKEGNILFCDQEIEFRTFDYDDITWPEDFFGATALSCSDVADNPILTEPDSTGYPKINENPIFGQHFCDINVGHWDEFLQDANCASGYELLRHWVIRNECEPLVFGVNPRVHIQSIKVEDNTAPLLYPIADVTVSTDPWTCTGSYVLPEIVHDDDCSGYKIDWYSSYGLFNDTMIYNILEGETSVTAFIFDDCGNSDQLSFTITTLDKSAPIALAKQDIVVALTDGASSDASAKLGIEAFDNYSYDNCSEIYFEVRRTTGSSCGNEGIDGHNNNVTFDNTEHDGDNENDTDNGQFVKFCCDDIYTAGADVDGDGVLDTGYHEVVLRVWDDANGTGIFGDVDASGHPDNYNEAWTYVKVEDNLPPTIACPLDVTISCFWAIDVSTDFGAGFQAASQANFDKTGIASAYSTCEVQDIEFSDRLNLDDCGVGSIRRTWRASKQSKNGPQQTQCIQNITVEASQSVFNVTPPNGQPFANAACTFDVNNIPESQKPSVEGGICDVIGESMTIDTFLFEGGVCKRWVVNYSYYNWCTGENMGPFAVTYIYEDTGAPRLVCEDACYSTDANCEYTLSLSKSAIDTSGCTDGGWLKWHVTVDTWADGTPDYVMSAYAINPANGRNITSWATNDDLAARYNLPTTVQWLYLNPTASGLNFDDTAIPEDLGGKYSKHIITYKVTDGCHNFSSCEETIEIADKKAPTPYCQSLATALMMDPDGSGPLAPTVELWACDFNVGSFDNCSSQEDLMFTFNAIPFVVDSIVQAGQVFIPVNKDVPHYFNENGFVDWNGDGGMYPVAKAATILAYNRGELQKWLPETLCAGQVFTCDDAPQADIVMSVWDKNYNMDFCNVFLTFGGDVGDCDPTNNRAIAGSVKTETGAGVEAVEVLLDGPVLEQRITKTDELGEFRFGGVSNTAEAIVVPSKDGDDDNGVSTLDLVLIQRHILLLAPLTSPYKVIAADINNSRSVSGADVVELRKLILGVTNQYPDNESWRFVDAGLSMAMGAEFPFVESKIAQATDVDQDEMNFIGVKIGDVNNSAEVLEGRSARNITLTFEDQELVEGEEVSIAITSANYEEVFGYQFTLDLNGVKIVDVQSNDLSMTTANVALLDARTMTVSYSSEQAEQASDLFTIVVKATKSGHLSDMLAVKSSVTKAESYVQVGDGIVVANISLEARSETSKYALYQNEPNPFKEQTLVGWNMAEKGLATITIYDVQGRILHKVSDVYDRGEQSVILKRSDFPGQPGIVYYKLQVADFNASKKMILID